jgi:hypothetical protein
LRIKNVFGTSENAVKPQIWIAVSVYVLVAIVRKRLELDLSLYTILQIFSLKNLPANSCLHQKASEAIENKGDWPVDA